MSIQADRCSPGTGLAMHVHYMQDEGFQVVQVYC
jgi:hypothetical protein